MAQRPTAEIKVPSQDPKKKEEEEEKKAPEKKAGTSKATGDKKEEEEEELSEEDVQLKSELEMLVERLKEPNTELYRPALETLRVLIRTSTSSMTSVPKPLKFLHPHYPELQKLFDTWSPSEDKGLFADIMSVLAMTYSDTQPRGTLRYRLLSVSLLPSSSTIPEPGSWGHEYVRHLAAELGEEYTIRQEGEEAVSSPPTVGADEVAKPEPIEVPGTTDDLRALALECAKFFLSHNAEPDAVDLFVELEMVDRIAGLVDINTFGRVCTYMDRCVTLLPPPDDVAFLRTIHSIYLQFSKFPEALSIAVRLNDAELIRQDFNASGNPIMRRQLALLLARAQIPLEWLQPPASEDADAETELPEDIVESLEEVYKSHLENTRGGLSANVDSARGNLAGTFVNAFVNAGFGNDKLMVEAEEGNSWVYKNKDHGMVSAAASLGLSLLWDTDIGLSHVDKYTYSSEEYIKAGALLATGILNSGVRTEADAAIALLGDYTTNPSLPLKTASIVGLGLAYAGSHREDLLALLLPAVADDSTSTEIAALSALSLGFVFVGSGNGEITSTILQTLMERDEKSLGDKWGRFLALGLALLYVGLQDASDATLETLKAIEHPVSRQAQILVEVCSFAATGNVLRIQKLLHLCGEHLEVVKEREEEKKEEKGEEKKESEQKPDDNFLSFAVLGISIIAMGEEIGSEMSMRQFNHLMHYGDPIVRKSVPLALGLISASNPQLPVLDTLSKYSHDNDLQVALNAIFAMGLVGAGTNNARLGQMLRQLAGYYYKEPDCLFTVRIAQGLVHMGKGTIGLNPFFSDRNIMSRPAVAGLLATLTAFTDAKAFVLDKYHWMLYYLVSAMYPRFLITLNEDLENLPVTGPRGPAGKPRTISGFQTHQTPVRLGTTERAELATEEYIPYAHVLEGFVILQKNPGYEKEDAMQL
ncbi:26S proteasome regulatory complex non-ATPase subcomplex Rpn1 subunit [Boletus reticuloceps]|uniref:26S proteasome regulatory subunit RPN1 n=1 Tax=Boletus reticuloceps TaxID=495285 RepID=A0A8I2YZ14_9AGAM|nr:26S proteasome regulatory complex non-ATPase subcomplex Rpn1 subunit [Boletus reticuloceps]